MYALPTVFTSTPPMVTLEAMTNDFQDRSVLSSPFSGVWIPPTWNWRDTLNHCKTVPFVGGDDERANLRLLTLARGLSALMESCTIDEMVVAFWPTNCPSNCGSEKSRS